MTDSKTNSKKINKYTKYNEVTKVISEKNPSICERNNVIERFVSIF